jgi:hypothetical protein
MHKSQPKEVIHISPCQRTDKNKEEGNESDNNAIAMLSSCKESVLR